MLCGKESPIHWNVWNFVDLMVAPLWQKLLSRISLSIRYEIYLCDENYGMDTTQNDTISVIRRIISKEQQIRWEKDFRLLSTK